MGGSPDFFKERWVMDGDISFFVLVKGLEHYIMILYDFSDFRCFGYDPGKPTQFQHTHTHTHTWKQGQTGTMYKPQIANYKYIYIYSEILTSRVWKKIPFLWHAWILREQKQHKIPQLWSMPGWWGSHGCSAHRLCSSQWTTACGGVAAEVCHGHGKKCCEVFGEWRPTLTGGVARCNKVDCGWFPYQIWLFVTSLWFWMVKRCEKWRHKGPEIKGGFYYINRKRGHDLNHLVRVFSWWVREANLFFVQDFFHGQYMVGLLPTEGYTSVLWSVKVFKIQSIDETNGAGNLSIVQARMLQIFGIRHIIES